MEHSAPNTSGRYTAAAPLRELHPPDGLPLPHPHRLKLSEYKAYPSMNPNGQARPDVIRADAWGFLGGFLPFAARITRQNGVHTLRVKCDAPIETALLIAVADALRRAQPREQAKQYAQSKAGRN